MKIFKNLIIVFLVIVFLTFFKVQAIECEPGISTAGMSNEQLNELIQKCNTKKN